MVIHTFPPFSVCKQIFLLTKKGQGVNGRAKLEQFFFSFRTPLSAIMYQNPLFLLCVRKIFHFFHVLENEGFSKIETNNCQ